MRGRALSPLFALALVACLDPSAATQPLPAPPPEATAPWPTPPAYDLAADVRLRETLADDYFMHRESAVVQDDVFVLESTNDTTLQDGAQRLHEALAALLNGRFSRRPSRAVTVYVFPDGESFDWRCESRLDRPCISYLGVWIKETREIMVDQEPGPTTLVHELVHPLIEADEEAVPGGPPAWAAPRWMREGLSALFELPVIHGGEIHGATNWRLEDLQRALGSRTERDLVHLDALFRMPADLFDGEHAGAAYAVARFACQWMDSDQDKLWTFWRTWRRTAADDPTGEKAFAEVFGRTPREADAAWQKWVRMLHRAG